MNLGYDIIALIANNVKCVFIVVILSYTICCLTATLMRNRGARMDSDDENVSEPGSDDEHTHRHRSFDEWWEEMVSRYGEDRANLILEDNRRERMEDERAARERPFVELLQLRQKYGGAMFRRMIGMRLHGLTKDEDIATMAEIFVGQFDEQDPEFMKSKYRARRESGIGRIPTRRERIDVVERDISMIIYHAEHSPGAVSKLNRHIWLELRYIFVRSVIAEVERVTRPTCRECREQYAVHPEDIGLPDDIWYRVLPNWFTAIAEEYERRKQIATDMLKNEAKRRKRRRCDCDLPELPADRIMQIDLTDEESMRRFGMNTDDLGVMMFTHARMIGNEDDIQTLFYENPERFDSVVSRIADIAYRAVVRRIQYRSEILDMSNR